MSAAHTQVPEEEPFFYGALHPGDVAKENSITTDALDYSLPCRPQETRIAVGAVLMKSLGVLAAVTVAALSLATPLTASAAAYSIASGDLLTVSVYRQEDMTYRVRVDTEGFIRFPVAGRIAAAGKSTDTIERTIAQALRRSGYSQPEVVVSVDQYAPRNVFVLGAVTNAANVQIPEGGEISAMQAISATGGLSEDADIDGIVVRRAVGKNVQTIKVPARDILNGKSVHDIELTPSDTVVVPRMQPISVLGTVKKPGEFFATAESALTVSRVIALAGGVERPNSLSQIRVTRGDKSFEVDIRSLLESGKGGNDMTLQPGDVVYVPETRW